MQKISTFGKLIISKIPMFLFMVGLVTACSMVFGSDNALPAVMVAIGLFLFPYCDMGVARKYVLPLIPVFYLVMGVAPALSLMNPWLGLAINLVTIGLIATAACEPAYFRIHTMMLLGYLFSFSAPVGGALLAGRIVLLVGGGVVISLITWLRWRKDGTALTGETLWARFGRNWRRKRAYLLRLTVGMSLAMFLGILIGLPRPLWLAVVVLSLTQEDWQEATTRLRQRTLATLVGSAIFVLFLCILIPAEFGFVFILTMGFVSGFDKIKQYPYQQVVNVINALYAARLLLVPGDSIASRLLCLAGGAAIVFAFHGLQALVQARAPSLSRALGLEEALEPEI